MRHFLVFLILQTLCIATFSQSVIYFKSNSFTNQYADTTHEDLSWPASIDSTQWNTTEVFVTLNQKNKIVTVNTVNFHDEYEIDSYYYPEDSLDFTAKNGITFNCYNPDRVKCCIRFVALGTKDEQVIIDYFYYRLIFKTEQFDWSEK